MSNIQDIPMVYLLCLVTSNNTLLKDTENFKNTEKNYIPHLLNTRSWFRFNECISVYQSK